MDGRLGAVLDQTAGEVSWDVQAMIVEPIAGVCLEVGLAVSRLRAARIVVREAVGQAGIPRRGGLVEGRAVGGRVVTRRPGLEAGGRAGIRRRGGLVEGRAAAGGQVVTRRPGVEALGRAVTHPGDATVARPIEEVPAADIRRGEVMVSGVTRVASVVTQGGRGLIHPDQAMAGRMAAR